MMGLTNAVPLLLRRLGLKVGPCSASFGCDCVFEIRGFSRGCPERVVRGVSVGDGVRPKSAQTCGEELRLHRHGRQRVVDPLMFVPVEERVRVCLQVTTRCYHTLACSHLRALGAAARRAVTPHV